MDNTDALDTILQNEEAFSVKVSEYPTAIGAALAVLAHEGLTPAKPALLRAMRDSARKVAYFHHSEETGNDACFCEEAEFWVCPDADGDPAGEWWYFDSIPDMHRASSAGITEGS